jgi:hypothetical protein
MTISPANLAVRRLLERRSAAQRNLAAAEAFADAPAHAAAAVELSRVESLIAGAQS